MHGTVCPCTHIFSVHWYLAIICNASHIARKPVIEDLASERTEDVDNPETMQNDNRTKNLKEAQDLTSPALAESEAEQHLPTLDDREEILVGPEESRLDLVDAHITKRESVDKSVSEYDLPRDSPAPETSRMEQLTLVDSAPKGILPSTNASPVSKKTKRKPGPPAKKWDPYEPTIIILDSLGGGARSQVVRILKDYLRQEGAEKRGMDATISQNAFYAKHGQIPMQENLSDCGVYLLGYIQKFFEDPDKFKNLLLAGEMHTETYWPDMTMPQIRGMMRDVLQGMYKQQEAEHNRMRAEKKAKRLGATSKTSEPVSNDKIPHKKTIPTIDDVAAKPALGLPRTSVELEVAKSEATDGSLTDASVGRPCVRLGSPFVPKPSTNHATPPHSPVPEAYVMKTDDSPPPIYRNQESTADEQGRMDGQDERDLSTVSRASPQVIPPSSKQSLKRTNSQTKRVTNMIEIHSPTRLDGVSRRPPSTSPTRAVSDRAGSQHQGQNMSPLNAKPPNAPTVHSKARFHAPAKDIPSSSPAPDSRGSSENPIQLDGSQDIITVSPPKSRRSDAHSTDPPKSIVVPVSKTPKVRPSPSLQRHVRHTSGGKHVPKSPDARTRGTILPSMKGFMGNLLGSALEYVPKTNASKSDRPNTLQGDDALATTIDKDGWEVLSPSSRKLVAQDDENTFSDDVIPETPPETRSSPSGAWNDPLPL
jgi:sentrin-specific protease 7